MTKTCSTPTALNADGTTSVDEIAELTGVELPEGDYDTLAGYLISALGYLPDEQTELPIELDYENLHFTILSLEERRIDDIRIEIREKEEENEEEEE